MQVARGEPRPHDMIPLPHHPVPNDAMVLRPLDQDPPNEVRTGMIDGMQPNALLEPASPIPSSEDEESINASDDGGRDIVSYLPRANGESPTWGLEPGRVESGSLQQPEELKRQKTSVGFPLGGFVVGVAAIGFALGLWGFFSWKVTGTRSHVRQWKPESGNSDGFDG
jgi:hypothetical protein